jgi:glutathione S-transferase
MFQMERSRSACWRRDGNGSLVLVGIRDAFEAYVRGRLFFESGAIMTYLVDKYDTDRKISYAPGIPEHAEQTSWLMFQMAHRQTA